MSAIKYTSVWFFICIYIFSSRLVLAAPLSPADRALINQEQQELLQLNQSQREELRRSNTPAVSESNIAAQPAGPCFNIHNIYISGTTLLRENSQRKLVSTFINQCLDINGITDLTRKISDWYIHNGYITSRAFITEQDLSSGVLHIAVLEGRLEDIRLQGAGARQLSMAFPGLKGQILNLRDIEQGMEQINRVRSTPVQIEILPGDKPGYSIVNLTATPEFPLSVSLIFDNSGQKSTGTGQISGSLTGNNLLGLADKWFVSGGRSSDFSSTHDAQNFQTGVSLPYGYSLLSGLNHTQKIFAGVATLNPTFSHGMPWFDAEDDHGKKGDLPKAEFKKWSINGSYQQPVANSLWWLSSVYGQWSPDRLYGSERLTIGGESSVRGFKEQYLSGDNGGYLRNELNYAFFTLPFIGQVSSVVAVDGGWLQKDSKDPWASGTLWGAAIGLSTTSRYYSGQFTLGLPVKYPDWLAPDRVSIYSRIEFVL